MTYEEAIRKIEIFCDHICIWDKDYCNNCENRIAIEALEKQNNIGQCKDCKSADFYPDDELIYCLENACVMAFDGFCYKFECEVG